LMLAPVHASDASKPHAHRGLLPKYDRVPPSKFGLSLKGTDVASLRAGKPAVQMVPISKGFTRAVSFQDIEAPEDVVWSAIMDLPNYPKMVEGVAACEVYKKSKSLRGLQTVCAKYTISVASYKMSYFMLHEFEPSKHAMTFHLDYDRCSDLSDTVGYWYVEDLRDGWCRVYYSTDSKMPAWIPSFARNALTNLAAKRSTSWVHTRCAELTGRGAGGGAARRRGLGAALTSKRSLAFLALLAWRLHLTDRLERLGFRLPSLPCLLPRRRVHTA